jgi:hypothetical protein
LGKFKGMKNWVLLLFFGLTLQLASAKFVIVQQNIPKSSFVFSENKPYSKDAALLLQRFVFEIQADFNIGVLVGSFWMK